MAAFPHSGLTCSMVRFFRARLTRFHSHGVDQFRRFPQVNCSLGASHGGLVGKTRNDAGDDQVGALHLRAAVCADRDAAGGPRTARACARWSGSWSPWSRRAPAPWPSTAGPTPIWMPPILARAAAPFPQVCFRANSCSGSQCYGARVRRRGCGAEPAHALSFARWCCWCCSATAT